MDTKSHCNACNAWIWRYIISVPIVLPRSPHIARKLETAGELIWGIIQKLLCSKPEICCWRMWQCWFRLLGRWSQVRVRQNSLGWCLHLSSSTTLVRFWYDCGRQRWHEWRQHDLSPDICSNMQWILLIRPAKNTQTYLTAYAAKIQKLWEPLGGHKATQIWMCWYKTWAWQSSMTNA